MRCRADAVTASGVRLSPRHACVLPKRCACAGLQGCGINTESAATGDTFELPFHVFSRSMPAQHASYRKTIVVVDPCQPGETYCADSGLKCDGTPCPLRKQLEAEGQLRPQDPPRVVVADSVNATFARGWLLVDTVCGDPLLFNIEPCVLGAQRAAARPCSLRVIMDDRFTAGPTVLEHVFAGPCDFGRLLSEDDGGCVTCSGASIRDGRCEPSQQYVRLYVMDPSGAAAPPFDVLVRVRARRAEVTGALSGTVAQAQGQRVSAVDAAAAIQRATTRALAALAAADAACVGADVAFGSRLSGVRSQAATSGAALSQDVTATATISLGADDSDGVQQAQLLGCLDAVLRSPAALQAALLAPPASEHTYVTHLAFQPSQNATASACATSAPSERMAKWSEAAVAEAGAYLRLITAELVRRHHHACFCSGGMLDYRPPARPDGLVWPRCMTTKAAHAVFGAFQERPAAQPLQVRRSMHATCGVRQQRVGPSRRPAGLRGHRRFGIAERSRGRPRLCGRRPRSARRELHSQQPLSRLARRGRSRHAG